MMLSMGTAHSPCTEFIRGGVTRTTALTFTPITFPSGNPAGPIIMQGLIGLGTVLTRMDRGMRVMTHTGGPDAIRFQVRPGLSRLGFRSNHRQWRPDRATSPLHASYTGTASTGGIRVGNPALRRSSVGLSPRTDPSGNPRRRPLFPVPEAIPCPHCRHRAAGRCIPATGRAAAPRSAIRSCPFFIFFSTIRGF